MTNHSNPEHTYSDVSGCLICHRDTTHNETPVSAIIATHGLIAPLGQLVELGIDLSLRLHVDHILALFSHTAPELVTSWILFSERRQPDKFVDEVEHDLGVASLVRDMIMQSVLGDRRIQTYLVPD